MKIAKMCVNLRKNMVHASYCTKELMSLDSEAKENGVTILNELGLDPGIDHLLAMKAIDEIKTDEECKVRILNFFSSFHFEAMSAYIQ